MAPRLGHSHSSRADSQQAGYLDFIVIYKVSPQLQPQLTPNQTGQAIKASGFMRMNSEVSLGPLLWSCKDEPSPNEFQQFSCLPCVRERKVFISSGHQ